MTPNQVRYLNTRYLPYDITPGVGGVASVPPFSRLFYVDAGTAVPVPMQDGSVGKPFSSIQAAISAAAVGGGAFTIYVTPGTYVGTLTIPDLDGIAIVGTDPASTIIAETPGDHTIKWTPAAGPGALVHSFRLEGFTVRNGSAGFDCVHVDGNAVFFPTTFMDTGLELVDLIVLKTIAGGRAGFFRCVGRVFPLRVTWRGTGGGPIEVVNCSTFVEAQCTNNGTATLEYNPATSNTPATGRNLYAYTLGTIDFLDATSATFATVLKGAPLFAVDDTSTCIGTVGAGGAIDGTGLVAFFGGPGQDYQPRILLNGTFGSYFAIGIVGGVLLPLPAPAVGAPAGTIPRVDLSLGRFYGAVSISRPVGPLPDVAGRQASFLVPGAGSVLAGAGVALDIRECSFIQAALAVAGTGTIDRTRHLLQAVGLPIGANVIAIVPPFPVAAGGAYQCNVSPLGLPAAVPFITAKGNAAFTVNGAIVGGADLELQRVE